MTQAATEATATEQETEATEPTTEETAETAATETGAETEDARVKRANAQAAKYRTELRETQAKLEEQGKTLAALAAVFNPEAGNADPAEQVQTITAEAEALRTQVREQAAELAVHALAAENGGNPNALLDSRAFAKTLQGLDPEQDNYREQVAEAIKSAVSNNATLAATGQAPSRGGAPGAGQGSAAAGGVTQEQFNAMGLAQRQELFNSDPDTYARLAAAIR